MDTNSEEWRNICEARELLTWSLADRRKQLKLVYEKRGHQAWLKLTDEIKKQWETKHNKHTKQQNLSSKTQEILLEPMQGELL